MIKKILLTSVLFCSLFFIGRHSFAQQSTTLLIVTNFKNDQELKTLFENSKEVYEFISLSETKPFLAIVTPEQQIALQKRGFRLQIIEENPDMSRYKLFYSAGENQGQELTYLGKIYQLSKNDILVRIPDGVVFEPTGAVEEYSMVPLAKKTLELSPPAISPTQEPIKDHTSELNPRNYTAIIVASVILVIMVAVIFYIKKNKNVDKLENIE